MPTQPLAERVRPQTPEELLGQEKIWAPGKPLFNLVNKDQFFSLIFWGPPGTGKTSLAHLIAKTSGRDAVFLSAVHAGVKDIRAELQRSEEAFLHGQKSLLMFMDEIHRLSKSQQDVLLPALEKGTIRFIGATTENPSFEVNSAVLSRSLVFRFQPLAVTDLVRVLQQAMTKQNLNVKMDDDVLTAIAQSAGGDARRALSLLDAVLQSRSDDSGEETITLASLKDFTESIPLRYDKAGEDHYDVISAFIKSIRASHPDAALHYLARMIDSGEDPVFIARRLLILASEDVGNANPTALLVAAAAMQAVHALGYPEARITLGQATTYLAASPKSNRAYVGIDNALADLRKHGALEVPMHLRNAPTKLMKEFGYGKNYAYAHTDLEAARKMPYLPPELKGRRYYEPSDQGAERQLSDILQKLRPQAD